MVLGVVTTTGTVAAAVVEVLEVLVLLVVDAVVEPVVVGDVEDACCWGR